MKLKLISALVCIASTCAAQIIQLHSITDWRMQGPDHGYTIDGIRMIDARMKLEDLNDFSASQGIYPKEIWITDGYGVSGDLTAIGQSNINLFYFGTFNTLEPTFIPFTNDELDSVYQWSLRGGKMIIGACAPAPQYNVDNYILNSRWGYNVALNLNLAETDYYPTAIGMGSKIYNGPFGIITIAYQGGAVQGYFDTIPPNSLVLAQDVNGNPNLILDCKTLDLILADGDGHNDLGGVSFGTGIVTENDIFWTNTIAYMDSIDDPPSIQQNGSNLSTGAYATYQWVLNGVDIPGATSQNYTAIQSGTYTVKVTLNCGCVTESPFAVSVTVGLNENNTLNNVWVQNISSTNKFYVRGIMQRLKATLTDAQGRVVNAFELNKHTSYFETQQLSKGMYMLQLVSQDGNALTKKIVIE